MGPMFLFDLAMLFSIWFHQISFAKVQLFFQLTNPDSTFFALNIPLFAMLLHILQSVSKFAFVMKVTIDYAKAKFTEFNDRIFAGRLPDVPIKLTSAATFLGKCVCHKRRGDDGVPLHEGFELRFNERIDLPPDVIDDTIIHEMIHYFILINGLHDTSSHGEIFKALMHCINAAHKRNVSISHRPTAEQRNQTVDSHRTIHVIASIRMRSGIVGVKVLPRNPSKVLWFYREISRMDDVVSVDIYVHDNPYFNRFPTSTALRYHPVEASELEQQLKGADKINPS